MHHVRGLVAFSVLLLAGACGGGGGGGDSTPPPSGGGGGGGGGGTPPTFSVTRAFAPIAFNRPVAMVPNPVDDVLYVAEKSGRVMSFAPGDTAASVAVDISARVDSSGNETGLLGIAFHPDVAANGAVYLSYTYTDAGTGGLVSRLSYFAIDSATRTIDPGSEIVIASVGQPFANHNGGHIVFEPGTRNLVWGLGDGGSGGDPLNVAQDPFDWLGSLLRLDLTTPSVYAIPIDNPFADGADGAPEVYVYGLRNPWRFEFDAVTGELWIGDVGQNTTEEIDLGVPGGNYGWRCFEGLDEFMNDASCPPASELEAPVNTYGRTVGQSVTGGFVYRGSAIPDLVGQYVFGDFVSGRIFAFTRDGGRETLVESGLSIASFAQDADGELYVLDFSSGQVFLLEAS